MNLEILDTGSHVALMDDYVDSNDILPLHFSLCNFVRIKDQTPLEAT